jgi:hypothetical protein
VNEETLDEVRAWFENLGDGWDLIFDWDEDICWANLNSRSNPDFSVQHYGRGEDELEAARSAKRRWEVEQIGSPNEGKPRFLP